MTPCSCGHVDPSPPYVGIQRGLKDEFALALWNCRACGTTRAVPWHQATESQRREAINAELSWLAMRGEI